MLIWPATRFVAGKEMEAALSAARALNAKGISVSLDFLGENVIERETADAACSAYVNLLRGIADAGLDSNISVKLTMLGLDIAPQLAEEHLVAILETAQQTENWVRIDMEGSPYTQLTLEIFYRVFESYDNVGVVIQSMLRRSAQDIERLIAAGARVRLCKGAYKEPAPLAYQEKQEVNRQFDQLAERLILDGREAAIATHDEDRINQVIACAAANEISPERFEFQMLYGVCGLKQVELMQRGYRVRVYVPFGEHWFPYLFRRLRERRENIAFIVRHLFRR